MKMLYKIEYDFTVLAEVEIDDTKTAESLKTMVEFWSGWEDTLEDNTGDYTATWLKSLGRFLIRNGRLPKNDEGWLELDGSHGITAKLVEVWSPDDSEISIMQILEHQRIRDHH